MISPSPQSKWQLLVFSSMSYSCSTGRQSNVSRARPWRTTKHQEHHKTCFCFFDHFDSWFWTRSLKPCGKVKQVLETRPMPNLFKNYGTCNSCFRVTKTKTPWSGNLDSSKPSKSCRLHFQTGSGSEWKAYNGLPTDHLTHQKKQNTI